MPHPTQDRVTHLLLAAILLVMLGQSLSIACQQYRAIQFERAVQESRDEVERELRELQEQSDTVTSEQP